MNPKLALALAVIGLVLVSNAFTGWKAYGWGQDDVQAKWDKSGQDRNRYKKSTQGRNKMKSKLLLLTVTLLIAGCSNGSF